MAHYSVMIKPASSLCNLRCAYCFYCDVSAHRQVASHGMMTRETAGAVITNLYAGLEDGDSLLIAFQGGEPTLVGLPWFRHFVDLVKAQPKRVSVSYALQTNGTAMDPEWCAFLVQHRFLVGLSLDGYAQHHNQYRLDPQGKGTFQQVMGVKRLFDATGVEYNVLCTLTNTLARHPQKVWQFLQREQIRYVQFTPCLSGLDGERDPWSLTPQRFHSFYVALFAQWKQAVLEGRYFSVKLFDDIVNLLLRQTVSACGIHGHCQLQCIIESDGSVYPCDFYVLDAYRGGSLAAEPFGQIRQQLESTGFLSSRAQLPQSCALCQYRKLCNGGCKRMAGAMYLEEATGFCGYQHLLADIGQELCDTGALLLGGGRPGPVSPG